MIEALQLSAITFACVDKVRTIEWRRLNHCQNINVAPTKDNDIVQANIMIDISLRLIVISLTACFMTEYTILNFIYL